MDLDRRTFLTRLAALAAAPAFLPGAARAGVWRHMTTTTQQIPKLEKSKAEWKQLLSEEQYRVLFEEGTERSGTSPLNDEKRKGTFVCAACFLALFESETKFDSGTGWPSFYDAIPGRLGTRKDFKLIWPRTEYHCIRCGGHQGHVFNDGPPPTGQRYCNNGVALRFIPDGQALPELRT